MRAGTGLQDVEYLYFYAPQWDTEYPLSRGEPGLTRAPCLFLACATWAGLPTGGSMGEAGEIFDLLDAVCDAFRPEMRKALGLERIGRGGKPRL